MFYLVRSNTKSMKDKIIDNLISKNNISIEDVYVFDFEELKTVEPAFLEYLTIDFEGNTKAIILKNADFINLKTPEQSLINRFSSAIMLSTKNLLIMTVDKINKTGFLNKKFIGDITVLEKDGPSNQELSGFITSYFRNRNINISTKDIELIKSRASEDFDLLISELSKLEVLQTNGEITREHIEKATLDFSRERLYKIAEYVITLNVDKIIDMMKQYRAEGESQYLIGEFMVKDFSRLLRYKVMVDKGFNDNQIKDMTGWNPWAIKNYSKWSYHWREINELKDFFYEVILKKCFLDLLKDVPEDPIGTLEKILVANVIGIKQKESV